MKNKTALRVYPYSSLLSFIFLFLPLFLVLYPAKNWDYVNGVELRISEARTWFYENSLLEMSVLLGQAYFQVIDLALKIQECHINRWEKIK